MKSSGIPKVSLRLGMDKQGGAPVLHGAKRKESDTLEKKANK